MSTSRVNKREIQRKRGRLQRRAKRTFTLSPSRPPRISTRPSVPPHVSRRVPAFLTRARQRHRVLIEFGLLGPTTGVAWAVEEPFLNFLPDTTQNSKKGGPLTGFQSDVICRPHRFACMHWYLATWVLQVQTVCTTQSHFLSMSRGPCQLTRAPVGRLLASRPAFEIPRAPILVPLPGLAEHSVSYVANGRDRI